MESPPLRILFVCPYVPATVRMRPFNFISQLAKRNKVTVVCLVQPLWEASYIKEVEPLCDVVIPVYPNRMRSFLNVIKSIPTNSPPSVAYSATDEIPNLLDKVIGDSEFDLIHTEFIRAAQWTVNINKFPKVFDAVDSLTLAYQRAYQSSFTRLSHKIIAFLEWIKMHRYEPAILHNYDYALVSSPYDKKYLSNHGPEVEVLPNGVDHEYFDWREKADEADDSLLFLGKMNYYVNVDSILYFVQNIYPKIKKIKPKIHLNIVGWNPGKAVRSLEKDPSITVVGGVPDIRPYIRNAKVSIAPMVSGSGIQNKILQAMAVGTPVVATSIASFALNVTSGEEIMIADKPEEFTNAVITLLKDSSLRKRISIKARRYVLDHHDWEKIGLRLEKIYHSLV